TMADLLQRQVRVLPKAQARMASLSGAADEFRTRMPEAEVRLSPLTGAAEMVSSETNEALTAPAARPSFDSVRDFLRDNARVYGLEAADIDSLHFIGESLSPSGLRMVRFEQMANGIPIFQSETRALLNDKGQLLRTLGLSASGAQDAEPPSDLLSPS